MVNIGRKLGGTKHKVLLVRASSQSDKVVVVSGGRVGRGVIKMSPFRQLTNNVLAGIHSIFPEMQLVIRRVFCSRDENSGNYYGPSRSTVDFTIDLYLMTANELNIDAVQYNEFWSAERMQLFWCVFARFACWG